MPLTVRSPVRASWLGPFGSTFLLRKVIVGYLSSSRKYDERRSLSRCALLVVRLATLMVTSTFEAEGLAGSIVPLVATSVKCPRTVIMPKCLAENSTWVCIGSIFQVMGFQYPP